MAKLIGKRRDANNFTPGVMERFGLDYEHVRRLKPDIIYLNMSMNGNSGPERGYLGYGSSMASVTGLQHLTGLPGRIPAGTGTNYPDHVPNPCHAAFAVLAALRHRRRTGEGQLIDMAQTEPTISCWAPPVSIHRERPRAGRSRQRAPARRAAGVYRCGGDDRDRDLRHERRALAGSAAGARRPQWIVGAATRRGSHRAPARCGRKLTPTARWTLRIWLSALQSRGVPAE